MASGRLDGVIALDGPSGTGKSTVARGLARRLAAGYLDTGAMYRTVTLAVLRAGIDPEDPDGTSRTAREARVELDHDPEHPGVWLDGADVSGEIRQADVTAAVSAVSAVPRVRELLVAEQRRVVAEVRARYGGVVVEGRDIGTVVVPDAGLKVFLTASADARAQRRSAQDVAAGRSASVASTLADVERRDTLDSSRTSSPLRASADAVELDTTDLGVSEVLDELTGLAEQRGLLRRRQAVRGE